MRQLRPYPVFTLKDRLGASKVTIYTDGAARGNPGPAAIGATIRDEKGNPIATISRRIGTTTNNQAEYHAVIAALEQAISLGARQVELRSDSELVVKQINGRYKVKNTALRPLYQKVVQLIGSLESFAVAHVPREQNTEADRLTNQALDAKRFMSGLS
jgi:ribonuclease HI